LIDGVRVDGLSREGALLGVERGGRRLAGPRVLRAVAVVVVAIVAVIPAVLAERGVTSAPVVLRVGVAGRGRRGALNSRRRDLRPLHESLDDAEDGPFGVNVGVGIVAERRAVGGELRLGAERRALRADVGLDVESDGRAVAEKVRLAVREERLPARQWDEVGRRDAEARVTRQDVGVLGANGLALFV